MSYNLRSAKAPLTPAKLLMEEDDSEVADEVNVLKMKIRSMETQLKDVAGKCDTLEQELVKVLGFFETMGKDVKMVKDFCQQVDGWIVGKKEADANLVKSSSKAEADIQTLIQKAEEAEKKVAYQIQIQEKRIDDMNMLWNKEMNVEVEFAYWKNENMKRIDDHAALRSKFYEEVEAIKKQIQEGQSMSTEAMSYRDIVTKNLGEAEAKRQALEREVQQMKDGHIESKGGAAYGPEWPSPSPPRTQQPACVVRAPKGMIQGRSAAARAQSFNMTVVGKLKLKEGHFSPPEATGMIPLRSKEGDSFELWLAFFNSMNDVSKLFTYKGQMKEVCPNVFVQPDLSKEDRMNRRLLVLGSQQFIANQANPSSWRFRWVDKLRVMITGPEQAKRFTVMEGGAARVVMEGAVRINKGRRTEVTAE